MKNKLYYFLFILYILMAGFILYINGIFTGSVSSWSNLMINLIFLLVIGILFVISGVSFSRLNRCTDTLNAVAEQIQKEYQEGNGNLWESYSNKSKLFENPVLDEAYSGFLKRMKSFQSKRGMTGSCELDEYINEDLLDHVGLSYFNSAISGTLTGLGILGTFIGLSMGLSSFSGNDIYTISDNVGPLLSGMKVAFHTSVYGIFFSLVFNFVYRSIMSDAYDKLSKFLLVFRECVNPTVAGIDENMQAMLIYQANTAHSLKTVVELLKGSAAEQTKGMERIVRQFTEGIEDTLGNDFEKLGRTLDNACSAQETYARNYKSMEETTRNLLESNRVLCGAIEQTLERQELFSKELKEQGEKLSLTCDSISEEIGNQLYTFQQMRDAYEK